MMRRFSNPQLAREIARLVSSPVGQGPPSRKPRQTQRRLSQEEVASLLNAYHEGASLKDLARDFQIHRATVAAHLDRQGMTSHRHGLNPDQIEDAIRLYSEGLSLATIAERFGVYPTSIYYWLRKNGATLRPRQGWDY
jgi:transposase-like protein